MLDPSRPLPLPELPGVRVYRDDADGGLFYALPARPRVAVGDDGRPALELALHGRRKGGRFEIEGGVVTVTVELALGDADRRRVEQALSRQTGGAVRLGDPQWVGGRVEVTLAEGVVLSGSPSLYGANRCALQSRLDAAAAGRLSEAWERGLPAATASYSLDPAGTPGRSRVFLFQSEKRSAGGGERQSPTEPYARTERQSRTESSYRPPAGPGEVRFAGPLEGARPAPARRVELG